MIHKNYLELIVLICFRSARELMEDAELLYGMKRFARSLFLSCIGMEELGKASLALRLYESNHEPDLKRFLEFWRDHVSKLAHAYGFWPIDPNFLQERAPQLTPKPHKNWAEFDKFQREFFGKYAKLTSDLKLKSLYVDITLKEKGRLAFNLPSQGIKKAHARNFIDELSEKIEKFQKKIVGIKPIHLPAYETGYDELGA